MGLVTPSLVLPRSYVYAFICLFVNIEIKPFKWYIQKAGVVLKTIVSLDSSIVRVSASRKSILFPLCAG